MQEACQEGGIMNKRWLLLGLLLVAGCAEKDPVEQERAKQDLERMSTKSKKEERYKYIVKETRNETKATKR